jgi:hypothetical protein
MVIITFRSRKTPIFKNVPRPKGDDHGWQPRNRLNPAGPIEQIMHMNKIGKSSACTISRQLSSSKYVAIGYSN